MKSTLRDGNEKLFLNIKIFLNVSYILDFQVANTKHLNHELSSGTDTKHLNHELSSGTDTNHLDHELSSRADTKHLNYETSSGNHYDITPLSDASQFMLKSNAANGFSRMYSLPVNSVVLKSANVEHQYTSHLNYRVTCRKTVLEKDVCSANINVTLMDQESKQSSGHFCISRSYPAYQATLDSGHSLTNGRRCPECAAGKSVINLIYDWWCVLSCNNVMGKL